MPQAQRCPPPPKSLAISLSATVRERSEQLYSGCASSSFICVNSAQTAISRMPAITNTFSFASENCRPYDSKSRRDAMTHASEPRICIDARRWLS